MDIINRQIIGINHICTDLDNEIDELLGIKKDNIKDILVLSGGGTKMPIHIGVLLALEKLDMLRYIKTISGTSAGAIIGMLYSIGYSPSQIRTLFFKIELNSLKSHDQCNILFDFGLDGGSNFNTINTKFLELKGFNKNLTFIDHYKKTGIELIMNGSCLNDKKCYYFSKDTYPNMKIIEALRITSALPGAFTPYKFEGKYFSDGGCTENYPIRKFRDCRNRIIGIYLFGEYNENDSIDNFEDFLLTTFNTMWRGLDVNSVYGYEDCTLVIKSGKIATTFTDNKYNMDKKEVCRLCDLGYSSVMNKYSKINNPK